MDPPVRSGNSNDSGHYSYQALDKDSIRVLHITAANNFDEEVHGELADVSLTKDGGPMPCNALSYSWVPTYSDGSHLSESIICSGHQLRVTPGLKTALRYIRAYGYREHVRTFGGEPYATAVEPYRHLASRPLWIDAICIDQANGTECAQQVELMANIYHHSMNTIVWLGEAQ